MIILDENFPVEEREALRARGLRVEHVGYGAGRRGMTDQEVLPLLLTLRQPTLFTRDPDFYHWRLCHVRYCLVVLEVDRGALAAYVRRLLRHPSLDTWVERRGTVIRVSPRGIHLWRLHGEAEESLAWPGGRA
ncbi:MAG: hypothetical protein HYY04_14055 [Chloroflexi bacterium]|nr:hypothetical protein [Chloroflexota bacterium]